jgi:hypothetical protein
MIRNEAQLRQSQDAVVSLQKQMTDLESDRHRLQPDLFAIMMEPIVDDLNKIQGKSINISASPEPNDFAIETTIEYHR